MKLTRPYEFALRLYLCLSTIVVSLISLASPESLNSRLIERAGETGTIVTYALVLFAAVGIVDLIVNDLLPERWVFSFAKNYRELGYIGIASMDLAFLFTMAKASAITWIAARYLLDGLFCAFVAWRHVVAHQPRHNFPNVDRRKGRA